jgi:AcrR family transcriptional regulator
MTLAKRLGMSDARWGVFEVVVELFATKGYASTSVRDVAAVLGIQAGSLYSHFESKGAMLAMIYDFCEVAYAEALLDLDELLKAVETEHPHELLGRMRMTFDKTIVLMVAQSLKIVIDRSAYGDTRAKKLVDQAFVEIPDSFYRPVLEKMVELGRIEPLDIGTFLMAYSRFELGATFFFQNDKLNRHAAGCVRMHEFLFSQIVRPKN